ncbi:MAG: alpha/beta hydrolase [Cyanobacteria bacterium QS_4_48_99]|nr:MAG: alpha/beta hydrolase [Cyanobacteria bacterium QS_4_48_99]
MQATPAIPGTYWQWRGQSIYYLQAGKQQAGQPPLLLIHGFGASTDHWRKNIAVLKQDFEVWAIDLIGFGRSAKPDWVYSGDLWREQLHDFLVEVIGQPVVLAGNSLGGYAALCVAAQHPELAKGLVLLNSAGPFSDNTETKLPTKNNSLQKFTRDLVRSFLLQPWVSFLLFQYVRQRSMIRKTLKQVYLDHSAVTNQLVEDIYRPSRDRGAAKVFASVFKTPSGEKVDVLLKQLKCPLLLLWGEGDPWMNTRQRAVKFRQHYPHSSEAYLQAGHCPHDEVPEQVNERLQSWVFSISEES